MLNKLLKYDLKYMLKSISVFYILSFFFAILTRVLGLLSETFINTLMYKISMGFLFAMLFNTSINTMIRSWVRFKESVYGDESYLTHTLPVTKKQIYQSKFLLTLIYSLVAFIVIVICLFIAFYTKDNWNILKDVINSISTGLNIATFPFVVTMLLIIFLEIFNGIQSGFLGIILGHKSNNNKIAKSILYGFITYIATQLSLLLFIYICGLFNDTIMSLFTSNVLLDLNAIKLVLGLGITSYLVITAVVYFLCIKKLSDGVNIQ